MKSGILNYYDLKNMKEQFKLQSKLNLARIKSKTNKHFNIAQNDSLTLVIAQGCKNNCKSCCRTFSGNSKMNPLLFNHMLDYAHRHFHSVSITGGEPTEHFDLITKYAGNYPDLRINITTNGENFNDEIIKLLKTTPNLFPLISLNGIEEVHDKSRCDGSFKKVYESIQRLINNRIPFGVLSVINQQNISQILSSEFPEFINKIGACTLELFQYYPVGNNKSDFKNLMLSSEQIDEAIKSRNNLFIDNPYDFLFRSAQLSSKRCHREIQINVDGSISYCPFSIWGLEKVSESDSDETILQKINRHLDKWDTLTSKSPAFCPLQSNTAEYINFFEKNGNQHSPSTGILNKTSNTFKSYCAAAKKAKMLGEQK
nr:radical SAM protein [uncultured Draconibacterium sp.]